MIVIEPIYEDKCRRCGTWIRYQKHEVVGNGWITCPKCSHPILANTELAFVDVIMREVQAEGRND